MKISATVSNFCNLDPSCPNHKYFDKNLYKTLKK
ncbi:hypothetical protein CY0110_19127 [Crocosphaera chwakensis CCY0110]|uniref:Uncharacterized protein n=1 Tax=Crocosphaera chwakensis CCY0110 TaxID=391612 RepID=A3IJF7_9CHRO|nr:hypothetical protein CY0110_19127 [Crocosphaera chwakensis CCY0110]